MRHKYDYFIGIDPGVNTGFAVWSVKGRCFNTILTLMIHDAMERCLDIYSVTGGNVFVRVEDARKRKWFGKDSNLKQQGAGSVKRDAKIWEDFLTDKGFAFEMIHPLKGGTKWKSIPGYTGRTSEHGRDAAMLVYDK